MSTWPIRVRLTLAFALAMAVVLAAVGAFVYLRVGSTLLEQIDEHLEQRAVTGADAGEGEVVQAIEPSEQTAVLSPEELARAHERRVFVTRDGQRLLAQPTADGGVLVVGISLEDREEALDALLLQLLVAGPVALLLASGAGYLLGGAALRPVEAMRRRAAEISAQSVDARLPLPHAQDEIARLGETLNAMLERLDAGLQRERSFVADASHELRTPLALLKGELEVTQRRARSTEELEAVVRSAAEEVDRLVLLAEDLLVLASTDDGRISLRRSDVDVREVVEAVVRRFEARVHAAGRTLDWAAPSVPLSADRVRLEQALGNLVDNALRHGEGMIRLEASVDDAAATFRVRDEGEGFPSDFLPRAFERFSRADESRQRGGAGLGLAIVEAVVSAHGGTAEAAGAEVRLTIPKVSLAP